MPTRRMHSKSRKGCQTCKKRRVKCDEAGPPCGNCTQRSIECTYAAADQEALGQGDESEAPIISRDPKISRRLDFELMHRWTASTYKGICTMPQDEHLLQVLAPREALQHEFLMDGILALAAADLALSSPEARIDTPEFYVQVAMENYGRSLTAYRAALESITEENHVAIFIFSALVTVLHLVMSRCVPSHELDRDSVLKTVTKLFDLLFNAGSVALLSSKWLETSPIPVQAVLQQLEDPGVTPSEDSQAAIQRLHAINDGAHDASDASHAWYKNAISYLEIFFAHNSHASWIAWPGMVEPDFASAVQKSEPLALIILMHWAVLVDRFSKRSEAWWVGDVGKDLVGEISTTVQPWTKALLPVWREAIAWAMQQVGLSESLQS